MASRISTNLPSVSSIISFRERILSWFDSNGRSYPWRETSDPFRLLIAELMLRRTKADQVKSVYERLLSEYPDIDSLAEADCKRVEEILYPLGLKWRVAAFVRIAREICEKYNCKLPETRQALLTLPGVGEYVAGAVLSIAYGKNEWIVDSNIVRVFRRFFGIETSKEGRRDKHVIEMAKMYVSGSDARKANLAIIDFAALVCAARKPKHEQCPVNIDCHFFLRERHRSTGHSS